ncbi:MAG: hypothetical protein ACLFRP_00890 [Puniceicoccaceae bacterium]
MKKPRRHILLFPLLVCLAACSRDNPAGLLPEEDRAPQFDRASEFLELGGVFYGYIDLTDQAESLAEMLDRIAASAMDMAPGRTPSIPLDFTKILEASGVEGLDAIGLSSRAVGDDMFHNRSILFFPEGPTGFFRFFGDTSRPFEALRFAPEGTDFVWESGYEPPVLRDTILAIADAIAGAPGRGMLSAQLATARPELGDRTLNDLIDSAGNRIFIILDFVEDSPVQIPPALTIPEPRLLAAVDGISDLLLSLRPMVEADPAFAWTDTEEGFEIRPVEEAPFPFDFLAPVVIVETEADRAYLASNRSFLEESLGSGKKLRDTDAFRKAAHLLPPEGVTLFYATPEFVASVKDAVIGGVAMNPMADPDSFAEVFEMLAPPLPRPVASVTTVGPEGIYSAGNMNHSHRRTMASLALQPAVMITGVSAAMAIPAFHKVRETSKRKSVLNNLRQYASGGQQHLLETGETRATYDDIVPEYIHSLPPVAGEDYTGLVVRAEGGTLRVTLANGETVEFQY